MRLAKYFSQEFNLFFLCFVFKKLDPVSDSDTPFPRNETKNNKTEAPATLCNCCNLSTKQRNPPCLHDKVTSDTRLSSHYLDSGTQQQLSGWAGYLVVSSPGVSLARSHDRCGAGPSMLLTNRKHGWTGWLSLSMNTAAVDNAAVWACPRRSFGQQHCLRSAVLIKF